MYIQYMHVYRPDIGRSLNTDEAAALGAVYQAAGQTKLFRVKKFIVKEANIIPIVVSLSLEDRECVANTTSQQISPL